MHRGLKQGRGRYGRKASGRHVAGRRVSPFAGRSALVLIAATALTAPPAWAQGACTAIDWASAVGGLSVAVEEAEAVLEGRTGDEKEEGGGFLARRYAAEARSVRAAWRTLQLVQRERPAEAEVDDARLRPLETRLARVATRLRLLPGGGLQPLMNDGSKDVCGDTPTEKKCMDLCDALNDCCLENSDDCLLLICDWECC